MPDFPSPDMSEVDLIAIMRALGDPTRLSIVRQLADGRPKSKTAEGWGCDVTKSTMAHHFRILRESGLTHTLVNGREHAIQLRRAELDHRFPGLIDAVLAAPEPGAAERRPAKASEPDAAPGPADATRASAPTHSTARAQKPDTAAARAGTPA